MFKDFIFLLTHMCFEGGAIDFHIFGLQTSVLRSLNYHTGAGYFPL